MVNAGKSCKFELEGWRPEVAGAVLADTSPLAMRHGFRELAALLADLVDQPESVTLVIPVDFKTAVQRRDPSLEFVTKRGSGMVGGRTMPRNDGTVDVVIDGNFLGAIDDTGMPVLHEGGLPVLNQDGLKLLRWTIAHEAQHVQMHRFGSDGHAYLADQVEGFATKTLFNIANVLCDEHRAECAAAQYEAVRPLTAINVVGVLNGLGVNLTAADAAYQQSQNVSQFTHDVLRACVPFWTALAFWTAKSRHGAQIGDADPALTTLPLWQRYVGPTWHTIGAALSTLPIDDLRTEPEVLHNSAVALTAALVESLNFIGFRFTDHPQGAMFFIDRHDFPSAQT